MSKYMKFPQWWVWWHFSGSEITKRVRG